MVIRLKKYILRFLIIIAGLYIIALALIYFFQEKLLFPGVPVARDYQGSLPQQAEEQLIPVGEGVNLHGLLFKSAESKGLVFYLHGNGGNAYGWGENTAKLITSLGYDLFVPDYRGYGKSGGSITSQAQLFNDVEKAYAQISKPYNNKPVVIAGYSIGTGIATHLAMHKKIKALILQAPYYSLSSLTDEKIPFIPAFIKRYTITTCEWLGSVAAPVYIFHGLNDRLIPFHNAQMLKDKYPSCELVPLPGVGHDGINESPVFINKLAVILY